MRTAELNTFNFKVENLRLFVWTRVFQPENTRFQTNRRDFQP